MSNNCPFIGWNKGFLGIPNVARHGRFFLGVGMTRIWMLLFVALSFFLAVLLSISIVQVVSFRIVLYGVTLLLLSLLSFFFMLFLNLLSFLFGQQVGLLPRLSQVRWTVGSRL